MKKLLLSIFLLMFSGFAIAQVMDRTETDCNAVTKNIYDVLNEGKVLFIAADGFDCSICMSHAADIKTLADENTAGIAVWGAMDFKYSSATPTCGDIDNWRNTYGWSNVFMFLDEAKFWVDGGYPTYTVIDPADKTIAYKGFSHTTAISTAKTLAAKSSVKVVSKDTYKVYVKGDVLVNKISATVTNPVIEIIDMTGKTVYSSGHTLIKNGDVIEIKLPASLNSGIYFAVLKSKETTYTCKFYYEN